MALLYHICGEYARSLTAARTTDSAAAVSSSAPLRMRNLPREEEEEEESGLEPDITSDEVRNGVLFRRANTLKRQCSKIFLCLLFIINLYR